MSVKCKYKDKTVTAEWAGWVIAGFRLLTYDGRRWCEVNGHLMTPRDAGVTREDKAVSMPCEEW